MRVQCTCNKYVQKVKIRNGIVHAGTMKVDDSTRDDIFETFRNLLSDNDVKPSIANFDTVIGNINKLTNGKLERICKRLKIYASCLFYRNLNDKICPSLPKA